MYEEEKKGSFIKDLIIKLLYMLLFLFLFMWLYPAPKVDLSDVEVKAKVDKEELQPLFAGVFNDNINAMKEAAKSYYTVDRLPDTNGKSVKMSLQEMLNKKMVAPFVDANGKILGQHSGIINYTIGQRKGIGLAAPEALYVVGIEPQTNTVYVGYKTELNEEKLILNNIQWSYPMNKKNFEALVKIRYNMKAVKAKISINEYVEITFFEPVSGITRGQACVLYDLNDGHLIGGGFI